MNTKFQAGQVWKDRAGDLRTVEYVADDPDLTYSMGTTGGGIAYSHTADGSYYITEEHERDLVELVTNADGTPANAATALPLEATPGLAMVAAELKAFEPDARQAFIHGLIRDMAVTAIENGLTFKDVTEGVREAVQLRDSLIADL